MSISALSFLLGFMFVTASETMKVRVLCGVCGSEHQVECTMGALKTHVCVDMLCVVRVCADRRFYSRRYTSYS